MVPLRFLALHAVTGFVIAAIFVGALLLADPGGAGTLLHPSRSGFLPLALLWLFSGLTFGVVQFAAALEQVPEAERDGGGGSRYGDPWAAARHGGRRLVYARVPARVSGRPRSPLR